MGLTAPNQTTIADERRARELRERRPTTTITCAYPGCTVTREVTVNSGRSLPRTCSTRHRVALSRLERREGQRKSADD